MEDTEIYEDPGANGGQPNTDVTTPAAGGTQSASSAGGNKIDPVSAGPNIGNTVAGRSRDLGASASLDNEGGEVRDSTEAVTSHSGSQHDDRGGQTGTTGHEAADDLPSSLSRAAERINPGDSQTGSMGSEIEK